jgi:glyoxylase-like metal-dependent hydrolase (beta-lactamase superfamily II)
MQIAEGLYAYPWSQTTANNCNTYLLNGASPVMVDPGHAQLYGHVENGLAADGIHQAPGLVILTHCHPDHLEAAARLQPLGAKLAMHPAEVEYMNGEGKRLAAAMGLSFPEITFDLFLEEGELEAGGQRIEVLHTPGHSPGHVCLHLPEHKALIAGDLVFAQGVGRVDFPGGDGEALKASINRVAELDLELVLPGHGPVIKGADQVAQNFQLITRMYFGML